MKSYRELKVHYAKTPACALKFRPNARSPHETQIVASVTCRRCVYQLWRKGEIEDSDERITASMRAHKRNAFIMLAQRAQVGDP